MVGRLAVNLANPPRNRKDAPSLELPARRARRKSVARNTDYLLSRYPPLRKRGWTFDVVNSGRCVGTTPETFTPKPKFPVAQF